MNQEFKVLVRQVLVHRLQINNHDLTVDKMKVIQLNVVLRDPEVRKCAQRLMD